MQERPPPNYLLCDGAAVSRTTYAKLFSVIGTAYGSGDGSTTFNVPNMSNIVTDVNTNVPVKGNGLALGMTDGTNNFAFYERGDNYQAVNGSKNLYGSNTGTTATVAFPSFNKSFGVTTDPSKSGIVGTVTRSQVACRYIIKC